MPLFAFENIYISLILVGVAHDAVAVKSVCRLGSVAPPREVAQRGEALRCARTRVGAVVGHEKRGRKYCGARAPRVRRILSRDAREPVLVEHPRGRNELRGTHGAAVAARLRARDDL